MLNETLKAMLGDDLVKQIETKIGSLPEDEKSKVNIVNIGDGSYIPRSKYNDLNTSVEDLKTQIATRDTQLEDLKKANKGNEDLTTKIKELQTENATIKTEYEAKLETQARNSAINEYLGSAKAKNVKTILPLLDNEKIIYKDGKLLGIDDQVEAIKKENSYLFEEAKAHNGGFNPNPGAGDKTTVSTNDAMNNLIRGI